MRQNLAVMMFMKLMIEHVIPMHAYFVVSSDTNSARLLEPCAGLFLWLASSAKSFSRRFAALRNFFANVRSS